MSESILEKNKFGKVIGRTDGQTDTQTDGVQT